MAHTVVGMPRRVSSRAMMSAARRVLPVRLS